MMFHDPLIADSRWGMGYRMMAWCKMNDIDLDDTPK